MSDFYVGVYSDASVKTFKGNRSGNFKTLLTEEIDLKNVEYKVAVSSITRYYETGLKDLVVVREKRQARVSTPKQALSLVDTYSRTLPDKAAEIRRLWLHYLGVTSPVYAYHADPTAFQVRFTVDGVIKRIVVFPNTVYQSDLNKDVAYKSEIHNGLYFELSSILGIGMVNVIGNKSIKKDMPFQFEFDTEFVKQFFLPQSVYRGTLTATKSRQLIELRAKNVNPGFSDLRTKLPYIIRMSSGVSPDSAAFQCSLKLFTDTTEQLNTYVDPPFYGNSKSVSIIVDDANSMPLCKIHSHIARLFKMEQEFEIVKQYVDVFTTVNDVETLYKSYPVSSAQATTDDVVTYLNYIGKDLQAPHKLTCTRESAKFTLTISEGLRIVIPHAFNCFTFEFTETGSEWPCTISYYNDASMGIAEKTFAVPNKKSFGAQATELQKATQKAFDDIAKEVSPSPPSSSSQTDSKGGSSGDSQTANNKLTFKLKRAKNEQTITGV